ncbi:hypothetical protein ZOSMA_131G00120 [Zostera marina]|uniref:Uncharacterized protein n=1 Tax=Zostera marina TaxID=29655 RepID=A0A0K9Q1B5_ZOSMR|nr:hypothetical protein ZOSMA_131G00120 [Zostera marina]
MVPTHPKLNDSFNLHPAVLLREIPARIEQSHMVSVELSVDRSLPTRFNLLAETVDVTLQKLKSWLQASATSTPSDSSLSNGLAKLSRVYSLVENLLQVPATQRMIRGIRGKKCTDVVLDGYVGCSYNEASKDLKWIEANGN